MATFRPNLVATFVTLSYATAFAQPAKREVPVQARGDASEFDACPGFAVIAELDLKSDDFLSARGGTDGRPCREVDRIHSGQRVAIC